MLFDEPTSALDPENVKEVLTVIQNVAKSGMTILIATHEMNFAQNVANMIWFMEGGKLLEQTCPDMFFKRPQTARAQKFISAIMG